MEIQKSTPQWLKILTALQEEKTILFKGYRLKMLNNQIYILGTNIEKGATKGCYFNFDYNLNSFLTETNFMTIE